VFLSGSLLVLGRRGRCRGSNTLAVIPRFGKFNPRFGGREFPVRFTMGIRKQGLDFLNHFCSQTTVAWGKSTKFPFRREKPAILPANSSAD
jgi:hypothetical protein